MVNELIYGQKNSWLEFSQGSSIKLARFVDSAAIDDNTIKAAFDNDIFKVNQAFDNTIVHSALGSESVLSHMQTVRGGTLLSEDNNNALQFSLATGLSGYFTTTDSDRGYYNILTPKTHTSILTRKYNIITDFDYKNIRALIKVICSTTETGTDTENVTLKYYIDNLTETHKYILSVRICLYEKINDIYTACDYQGYKGFILHSDTSYTTNFHETTSSDFFKAGKIGTFLGADYGSGGNNNTINIFGTLTSRLSDVRVSNNDINIISGGCEKYIDSDNRAHYFKTYTTDFEEWAKRQAACFGLQFVTDTQYLQNDENSTNVYMGVLDDNYIGHGGYTSGTANLNNKQYQLNSANESTFNPSKEADTNIYYNESTKPHDVLSTTAFTTKYVLTFANLQTLANKFYNVMDFKPENLDFNNYNTSLFLTNNALDTIVSCKKFPFQVASAGAETVQFGRYSTDIQAPTTAKKVQVFEFSGFSCYREFDDFRDYEPYTSYELKIPFCGSVKLSTAECVGLPITVTLSVDIETGNCTAFIYADNKLIDSVSGNCAVDVAISGIQQATLDSQIFNAAINQRQAKINSQFVTAKGVISMAGAVTGILKSKKSPMALTQSIGQLTNSITNQLQAESDAAFTEKRTDYELSHVQTPYKCVGAVSSAVCESETMQCVLIKSTPLMLDDYNKNIYASTVGFACCINAKLGNMHGLTVCSGIDTTGIPATETEKSIIKQLCCSGVRV